MVMGVMLGEKRCEVRTYQRLVSRTQAFSISVQMFPTSENFFWFVTWMVNPQGGQGIQSCNVGYSRDKV